MSDFNLNEILKDERITSVEHFIIMHPVKQRYLSLDQNGGRADENSTVRLKYNHKTKPHGKASGKVHIRLQISFLSLLFSLQLADRVKPNQTRLKNMLRAEGREMSPKAAGPPPSTHQNLLHHHRGQTAVCILTCSQQWVLKRWSALGGPQIGRASCRERV